MKKTLSVLILLFGFVDVLSQSQSGIFYNDRTVDQHSDSLKISATEHLETLQDSLTTQRLVEQAGMEHRITGMQDSLIQGALKPQHRQIADSIFQMRYRMEENTPEVLRKIYSEKAIKAIYDSLGIDRFAKLPYKTIPVRDMVDIINDEFSSHPLMYNEDSLVNGIPSADPLSLQGLERSVMSELPPLGGLVMRSGDLKTLDSVRKINLKRQGLELKEHEVSAIEKVTEFKTKLNFWDRTYFEGIVGISTDQLLLQLSPALGYHFTDNFSMGMGPIVQVMRNAENDPLATIGFRPFLKQEFMNRRAYLQAEYIMNPSSGKSESITGGRNSLLTGAGLVFPVSRTIGINVCVLYRTNERDIAGMSPWVLRIGISSVGAKE